MLQVIVKVNFFVSLLLLFTGSFASIHSTEVSFWIDADISYHRDSALGLSALVGLSPEMRGRIGGLSTVGLEPAKQAAFLNQLLNSTRSSAPIRVYGGIGPESLKKISNLREVLETFPGFSIGDLRRHQSRAQSYLASFHAMGTRVPVTQDVAAHDALKSYLHSAQEESVVIIALGPLSNLAGVLDSDPTLVHKIKKVIFLRDLVTVRGQISSLSYNVGVDIRSFLSVARTIGSKLVILNGKALHHPLPLPISLAPQGSLLDETDAGKLRRMVYAHLTSFVELENETDLKMGQPTGFVLAYGLYSDQFPAELQMRFVPAHEPLVPPAYNNEKNAGFLRISSSGSPSNVGTQVSSVEMKNSAEVTATFRKLIKTSLDDQHCEPGFNPF